jgi:hypothetical protein
MLPRADLNTVKPVGPAEPLIRLEGVGGARQEAFQRSLQTMLGQPMQGQVLSRLTDGSFLVKVGGTSARMLLPPGAQVGSEVPLTLVAINPRPTFQIATSLGGQPAVVYSEAGPALPPGSAATEPPLPSLRAGTDAPLRATAHGAALLGKAPLIPADQLPALDHDSAPASLSDAAKVITSVLAAASKTAPSAILSLAPLVRAPTVEPAKLAAAFRDAIGNSGLFYESHVAEWSDGKRPLAELMREPQMQRAANANAPEAGGRAQAPATDPAIAQLINLQLTAHEQARVAWQGQVWPGQDLQWEINKDAPEGGAGAGGEPEPAWRSAVRLRFALLGEIAATVAMAGDRLHIQLQAGSSDVGRLLREHAGQLSAAMEAAGTPLTSLNIATQPAAPDD